MARVSLERITKSFDDVTVIPALDLSIADKEFVVLVGPSGCGKTTTLRMIAGLERPSSGTIHIGDRDVTHLRPGLRNCSMVFQSYALYPHMTVRDNIAYGMKVRGVPKAEIDAAVEKAVKILDIGDYLDRRPKNLSGGQRQRVAIGRAIVRQPDVFLFDEPLSNLDAKLRVEMRTEIKSLHRRLATTIVYVTHDQVEAMTMADRVVVMNKGRIEQAADPITLYQRPANRFVAAFIGAPAMNFLEGRLVQADGLRFQGDDGIGLPVPADRVGRARDHLERPVTLGIRPEHCAGVGAEHLPLDVVAVEPMGPHTLLVGHVGRTPFTAQVPPGFAAAADETVPVGIDTTQIHLFDRATGDVI
jgi:multiple sugar transport system ATP-binding protein